MRDGLVSKEELEEILAQQHDNRQQRISGRRLGEILIQRGRVTPTQVAKLVAEQYELPFLELELSDIDLRAAAVLSEDDACRFWAIPVSRRPDGTYLLAIADPATVLFSDELRRRLGSVPRFAVVGPDAIERAIDFVHSQPLQFPTFPALEPVGEDPVVVPFQTEESAAPEPGEDSAHRSLAQTWPPLGALLVREGFLTDGDLDTALAQQRVSPSHRLGEILVEKGIVTRSVVARLVAEQYELPYVELGARDVDPEVARRLPEEIARRLSAVPVAVLDDASVEIAISDPTSAVYSDELQRTLDSPLTFVVASPDAIETVLDAVHVPAPETTDFDFQPSSEPQPSATVEEDDADVEQVEQVEPGAVPEAHVAWHMVDEPTPETTAEDTEEAPSGPSVFEGLREAFEADGAEGTRPFDADEEAAPEVDFVPEGVRLEVTDHEATTPFVDTPSPDDEPSWASRLELVDEVAWPEDTEQVEEDAFELSFLPAPGTEEPELPEDAAEGASHEAWDGEDVPEPAALAVFPFPSVTTKDADTSTGESHLELVDDEATAHVEAEVESTLPETEATDELVTELEVEPPLEVVAATELEAVPETAFETVFEADAEPVVQQSFGTETEADTDVDLEPATTVSAHEAETEFARALEIALSAGATTVHFSPLGDELTVRARVDGAVRDLGAVSHSERDAAVARLQSEGRVRTHVVATSRGEKTTLFVRAPAGTPTAVEDLGLAAEATSTLRTRLERPSGAILVCGPGRSGTTTTLYAALRASATRNRIVTTVEHPVERLLPDVDQVGVDPASGTTFASALRELRFTDPDVVLVGALGDLETAELALQMAYEGRLVLSALLTTGGTAAALVRLVDMGVDPTLLASSVGCVVAQRLVRTICPDCRETYYASQAELEALGQPEVDRPRLLARGRGCPACEGDGFRGRIGLFEVLSLDDEIRQLVREGASVKKIQRAAVSAGMRTLHDEGVRLCLEGVTTVAEVERVLSADS